MVKKQAKCFWKQAKCSVYLFYLLQICILPKNIQYKLMQAGIIATMEAILDHMGIKFGLITETANKYKIQWWCLRGLGSCVCFPISCQQQLFGGVISKQQLDIQSKGKKKKIHVRLTLYLCRSLKSIVHLIEDYFEDCLMNTK